VCVQKTITSTAVSQAKSAVSTSKKQQRLPTASGKVLASGQGQGVPLGELKKRLDKIGMASGAS